VPEPPPAPEPEDRPATVVDKRAAAEAVKEGQRAIAANAMGRAERAFVRALQHDPHRAAAYAGLGEVYFESGSYAKAVTEAKKAVRRAPRVAKYRMLLGDAYLKVVDLRAAREQYLQAQELGHPSAAKRLATVDAKLQ
jgi:Flp pilus assembly protein TadD